MSQQTIFRVANRQRPYSQISNDMLRDKRLTYEARGVLGFILSLPPDWQFNMNWLLQQGNLGRDRALKIIKLLTAAGYCVKSRNRNKDGTLSANEFVFTDDPRPLPENQAVADKSTPCNPVDSEPHPGFQGVGTNKEITKKQNKNNLAHPPSTTAASERKQGDELGFDSVSSIKAKIPKFVIVRATELGLPVNDLIAVLAERPRVDNPSACFTALCVNSFTPYLPHDKRKSFEENLRKAIWDGGDALVEIKRQIAARLGRKAAA